MNKQCDIVQDLLPLYAEEMLSDGSKSFVEEHLAICDECTRKSDEYKKNAKEDFISDEERKRNIDESRTLKRTKRRLFIRLLVILLTVAMGTLIIGFLVGSFERKADHRSDENPYPLQSYELDFFTKDEKDILLHTPSVQEKQIACAVLRDAETAFKDNGKYTFEEKQTVYGPLAKYAFDRESVEYFGTTDKKYLLELMGCKIGDTSGYIWISCKISGYKNNYDLVTGDGGNALWEIAKDENQQWKVVSVKEHP